ncbi:hypothetical protein D6833_05655 [Candidatus Parcubacteria bacterium]|nr:MAG: hypothetical protein D6833_05655 [Candidatus Parcubacteria bacterium]
MEVVHRDADGALKSIYRLDLPDSITREKLREFAAGVFVKGLSHGAWTGGAGLFSRSEYDRLMAELERAGIVAWIDPENRTQGRKLTRPGRAALEHWRDTL